MSKSFYTPHEFNSSWYPKTKPVKKLKHIETIDSSQSDDINILNATAGSIITLPMPDSGLTFNFIVSNSASNVFSAPSACIYGGISISTVHSSGNLTASGNTTITTTSGSAIGDSYSFVTDGDHYYLSGNVANFNACQFT